MSIKVYPDGSIETDDLEKAILLSQRLTLARETARAMEQSAVTPEKPAAAMEKPSVAPEKPAAAMEKPSVAPEKPAAVPEQYLGRHRRRMAAVGAEKPVPTQHAFAAETLVPPGTTAPTSQAHKTGWEELVENLGPGPARLLELLRTRHELSVNQLREITGAKNNQQVTGWVLGLLKNINKFKMKPDDIYRREIRRINGIPTSVYIGGPMLQNTGPIIPSGP